MVNTKTKFPREYTDQVISKREARTASRACTWSGPQATSYKLQATSGKPQASSSKLQAASFKHQAQTRKYNKLQAPSSKHQASSRKLQAPRFVNHGTSEQVYWTSDQGPLLR